MNHPNDFIGAARPAPQGYLEGIGNIGRIVRSNYTDIRNDQKNYTNNGEKERSGHFFYFLVLVNLLHLTAPCVKREPAVFSSVLK
jgi:hypothetical protein